MSFWQVALAGVQKLLGSMATNNALIGVDLQEFNAAMVATIKAVADMKAGTLTPEEFLTTTALQLKVIAIVYPPAATIEKYVEAGDIIVTALDEFGIIKTDPGKPLIPGTGINPNVPGGETPIGV